MSLLSHSTWDLVLGQSGKWLTHSVSPLMGDLKDHGVHRFRSFLCRAGAVVVRLLEQSLCLGQSCSPPVSLPWCSCSAPPGLEDKSCGCCFVLAPYLGPLGCPLEPQGCDKLLSDALGQIAELRVPHTS